METMTIDACGRSCPEPVLMAKRALASGESAYIILVDNQTAVQNVSRFADYAGYDVTETAQEGIFRLALKKR